MMMLLPYGIKTSLINVDEYLVRCPCCEADNWADVGIISHYYHFSYLPIFPFEKDAFVVCKKCGLRRGGVPFNNKLIKDYLEVKTKYKHPWYTYTGVSLVILIILLGIIFSI